MPRFVSLFYIDEHKWKISRYKKNKTFRFIATCDGFEPVFSHSRKELKSRIKKVSKC